MIIDNNLAATTHPRELISNLAEFNNQIIVISGLFDQKSQRQMHSGVKISRVLRPNVRFLGYLCALLHGFFLALWTARKQKIDIIYTRNGSPFPLASLLSRITGIPLIREVNGVVIEEVKIEFQGIYKLIIPFYVLTEYIENRSCDHIITVTTNIQDELIKLYALPHHKITVIQNGANTDLFRPLDSKNSRMMLGLDPDRPYVCWVGSMVEWQGLDDLILAIPEVLRSCPEAHFLIVGDGAILGTIRNLARKMGIHDSITFVGVIKYESVPIYINAADCCCCCCKKKSKFGYSPLKLYEYMACAKPVVAPKLRGFEIIENENAGILYEPENPKSLASAIIRILSMDESISKQMGENGRSFVCKNHSWRIVAEKTMDVFSHVLRGPNRGRVK